MPLLTEPELVLQHQQNLFILDKLASKDPKQAIEIVGEYLPGFLQISRVVDKSLIYINQSGAEHFHLHSEEIKAMKGEFVAKYVHSDTISTVFPRIIAFAEQGDNSAIHSEFQKISARGDGEYSYLLTSIKPLEQGKSLVLFSVPVANLGGVSKKIIQVLEEDEFVRKHFQYFNRLGKREKELIRFIALGKTNKEIGEILCISELTVKTHRKNIKQKLNIKSTAELVQMAYRFDLI
jgi:DNA-binding CsgD family transcriptional regulator